MKALFAILLIALCGCVAVPHTTITGDLNKGTFTVKAPKDGDLQGLDIERGTNGTVRVHIDKHVVRMNPDVITQTGAAQAAISKAILDGAGAIAGQVTAAAVSAAKKP